MTKKIDLNQYHLTELNDIESLDVIGGGFAKEAGKCIGWLFGKAVNACEAVGDLCKMAVDYQHSLPPNLKK